MVTVPFVGNKFVPEIENNLSLDVLIPSLPKDKEVGLTVNEGPPTALELPEITNIPRMELSQAHQILLDKYGKKSPTGNIDAEGEVILSKYNANLQNFPTQILVFPIKFYQYRFSLFLLLYT